jgi:phosphoadenosine phosphosulfate reductase
MVSMTNTEARTPGARLQVDSQGLIERRSARDAAVPELIALHERLKRMSAQSRVAWTLENLPGRHLLASSFGIQLERT